MRMVAAAGAGGAVLQCAPSFTVSSPVSALLGNSPCSKSRHSPHTCCSPNSSRRSGGLRLPAPRRGARRGSRRFESARANEDEGADVNRDSESQNGGENGSVDWDKAWSSFRKPQKRKSFLKLDMEQYVSRQPKHSNYPLSEEVDPLKKSERSLLSAWTSMKFTYALVVVIVGLVVYMVIIVGPPPHH